MKHCQRPLGPLFASALVLYAALVGVPVANAAPVTTTFTTSGIWKAPPGVTSITVEAWGGGGAGGGRTASGAAGGGGGGAFAAATVAVTPGADLTVTVAGTRAGTTGNGLAGASSLVTNSSGVILARAAGGAGGTSAGIGGAGGASGASIGDTIYAGGNGADAAGGNSGGGGGGAGTTGAGGGASGTTAGTGTTDGGGNGGAGLTTNGAGLAGSVYGGGGGGARRGTTTNRTGGAGAAGQVRITYDLTPGPALEFAAGDGNPTVNGPVVQTTIQFRDNTDNPGGNTFATYNPAPASPLTLTAALSNQQYDYAAVATPAGAVLFGYGLVGPQAIFPLMNAIGAPASADFTSAGAPLNQGISVANNSAIEVLSAVTPLRIAGRATNQQDGRWRI